MIIDETQNLTRLQIKTIISRVGLGTKIVLTGDVDQIDNPYISKLSSGLTHIANQFKSSNIAGHIVLPKTERSQVADLAAKCL